MNNGPLSLLNGYINIIKMDKTYHKSKSIIKKKNERKKNIRNHEDVNLQFDKSKRNKIWHPPLGYWKLTAQAVSYMCRILYEHWFFPTFFVFWVVLGYSTSKLIQRIQSFHVTFIFFLFLSLSP